MILNSAYTGEGKQFFFTNDIVKASNTIPFFWINTMKITNSDTPDEYKLEIEFHKVSGERLI